MEAPTVPSHFAHQIIRQLVDHMYGPDVQMGRMLANSICKVFLDCGGKWTLLAQGNLLHFQLLFMIVTSWFQEPRIVREDLDELP